jgi:2'-5' RNA ligase
MTLYFVAILPPTAVQRLVRTVQHAIADQFQSQRALSSPPHLTLYPPIKLEQPNRLHDTLTALAPAHPSIPIRLSGFAAFPPRVIYIHVQPTPELMVLQAAISSQVSQSLGLRPQFHPYVPHLTVAFRDLSPPAFRQAWAWIRDRPFEEAFMAHQFTLLKHQPNPEPDQMRWQSVVTYRLGHDQMS